MSRHPHKGSGGNTSSVVTVRDYLRVAPSEYLMMAAREFRRLNELQTPAKRAAKAWKKSGQMRNRNHAITLPTKPFDHREGS